MKRADAKEDLISHMKTLRAFALSLTRNSAAADDLVQETVLKAWSNMDIFQEGTKMSPWLFTLLRNSFYSTQRKVRREVMDTDGEHAEGIATKPDHDGRLNLQDFRAAFDTLPPEQREVLTLVGALQHSYEEAAEMCGVQVGTIKSRLNRGRAALARAMAMEEGDPLEMTDAATQSVLSRGTGSIG